MEKAKFLKLAASLGIAVPACLLGLCAESHATVAKELPLKTASENNLKVQNQVKSHLLDMIGPISKTEYKQLAHTDVHANYTISHTNVHTNYNIDRKHVNHHSNTPSKRVNEHHNSPI